MKKPFLDKVLDNTHTISYALYGAIGAFIIYRLIKNKQRTSEASFSSFAGTANNFFNSTFGGVTKGGSKGTGTFPTSPIGGGKGGNLFGTLPSGTTTTGTTSGSVGGNTGIPSQYQNVLNALLTQYGQVKYKDCYNKFVAYAQTQGLTPASAQWYPEMVSFMRKCLSGSTGTTTVNTETGQVTTGDAANPFQAELDGLMATYGVTKYRTCLSNWMNYAQLNGLTPQTTPNYYQTMFVFMQKCLQ
jgi:hypothetical protein